MPTIHNRIEDKRGCGYRQPGGFYLVVDGKGVSCGLLPIDLPESISTSRASQWRKAHEVCGVRKQRQCTSGENCKECWIKRLSDTEPVLLNFVGMEHYRTAQQFEREAGRAGISRRIPPHLIGRIVVGKTPVLLAHRNSSRTVGAGGGIEMKRQIFTGFKPQRIEYIVTGKESQDYLEKLDRQGITLIRVQYAGKVLDLETQAN